MADLPRLPSGGNRRELDRRWLGLVERDGLRGLLDAPVPDAPAELYAAVDRFNAGEFWDCHETLEELWRATPYPLRLFYHAIIKIAVGFHHLRRHNRHGARTKLVDGVRLLEQFQPEFMGVATGRLRDEVAPWLAQVSGPGRARWPEMDADAPPQVHMTDRAARSEGA